MKNRSDNEEFEEHLALAVLRHAQLIYTDIITISTELGLELSDRETARYFKDFTESIDYVAERVLQRYREMGRGVGHDKGDHGPGGGSSGSEEKFVSFEKYDDIINELNLREKHLEEWENKLERKQIDYDIYQNLVDKDKKLREREQKIEEYLEKLEEKEKELEERERELEEREKQLKYGENNKEKNKGMDEPSAGL